MDPSAKKTKRKTKNDDDWADGVEEDLSSILAKYINWRRESKDRDKCRNIVEETRAQKGL